MNQYLSFFIILVFYSCQDGKQEKEMPFDVQGKSQVCIINNSQDSLAVQLENWYVVPFSNQKMDTLLASSQSVSYRLKVQGRNHYDLSINQASYKIFSQPNAQDTIVLNGSSHSDSIAFLGDSKEINEFLLNRGITFGSSDAVIGSRVLATHHAKDIETVMRVNDSITAEQIEYLKQNKRSIPDWYLSFEEEEIRYLNIQFKLNSFSYRKEMLDKEELLPETFVKELSDDIEPQNPQMLGNVWYTYFLNDYIHYKTDLRVPMELPSSNKGWQTWYNNHFETASQELSGITKDFYIASSLSRINNNRSHILDTAWISQVKNEQIQATLRDVLNRKVLLPEGVEMPNFYLRGLDETYYEPKDFRGDILLINFWATWCKPCFKEFPFENELVEKYENKPVTIVNICIDSDEKKWKKTVEEQHLTTLNLVAVDQWSDVLSERFDISSLPHSILIDEKGRVIKNKCPKASEGIDKQIDQRLQVIEFVEE